MSSQTKLSVVIVALYVCSDGIAWAQHVKAHMDNEEAVIRQMHYFARLGPKYVKTLRERARQNPESRAAIARELGQILSFDVNDHKIGPDAKDLWSAQLLAVPALGKIGPESLPVIAMLLKSKSTGVLLYGLEITRIRMMESKQGTKELFNLAVLHSKDSNEFVRHRSNEVIDFYKSK